MHFFELLQLASLITGIFGIFPAIEKVFVDKSKATEALSLTTTGIFVIETMIRLPNVGKGLFKAIKDNNKEDIKRQVMVSVGIFCVGFSFYVLLYGISKFNSDRTPETKRNRQRAKALTIIFGILILAIIIYYVVGISKNI